MPRLVLVVDDSLLVRHTVSKFLRSRGYQVQLASDGVEALELLDRISPDVVVTDRVMPRMSGTELMAAIRTRPEFSDLPVVMVAGRRLPGDNSDSADYVIHKDIDIVEQLNRVLMRIFPVRSTA